MQRISSVGVLSCAKMLWVLYGCMALLFIPIALIGGLAGMASQQSNGAIGGAVMLAFSALSLWRNRIRVWRHRGVDLQAHRQAVGRNRDPIGTGFRGTLRHDQPGWRDLTGTPLLVSLLSGSTGTARC